MIPFYLITNAGTLVHNMQAQTYPRHLVLAQVLKTVPKCVEVLLHMRKTYFPRIILDNGAYEGELCKSSEYIGLISVLRPSVAVLPDLVGAPAENSRKASFDFHTNAMAGLGSKGAMMEFMYVPQGQTKEENLAEFAWAIEKLPRRQFVIGLGKSFKLWGTETEDEEVRRMRMVNAIAELPGFDRARFHLLGARWNFSREYERHLNIQGMDTYKPCRMAFAQTTPDMANGENTPHVPHTEMRIAPNLRTSVDLYCKHWNLFNGKEHFAPAPTHRKQVK